MFHFTDIMHLNYYFCCYSTSFTVDLEIKLAHDNAKSLEKGKRMPEFQTEGVFVNFSKNDNVVSLILILNVKSVGNENKVLD